MADARIRSLQVRPIESADLCFELPGILGARDAQKCRLGQRVTAAPSLGSISAKFSDLEPGNPARLRFNAKTIHAELAKYYLVPLRNDVLGAVVDQAIANREALFLQKYKHKKQFFSALSEVFPKDESLATSRVKRLLDLAQYWKLRMEAVAKAYDDSKTPQVVSGTVTETRNEGIVKNEIYLTPVTMVTPNHDIQVTDAAGNVQQRHKMPETKTIPHAYRGASKGEKFEELNEPGPSFKNQEIVIKDDSHIQRTTSSGPEFRHPRLGNQIEALRTLIDLQDETLQSRLQAYAVPETEAILESELRAIDLEVLKSQLEFAHSYLVSPISGIITAIYKDIGESVQAGEPIVRVENDDSLLLVGLVQHRGLIRIGQKAKLGLLFPFQTTNQSISIMGEIRSVRGHQADDDEWDIVIECKNPGLPLNYAFDRDTTRIEVA